MPTKCPSLPPFPLPSLAAWREKVEAELKGARFEDKLTTRLPEGIVVQPLYTPTPPQAPTLSEASAETGTSAEAGASAEVGTSEVSERTPWQIQQIYNHPSPSDAAEAIQIDRKRGVSLAWLDLAPPSAPPEAPGLRLQTSEDWADAFAPLEAQGFPLWPSSGASALLYAALRVAAAHAAKLEPSKLSGAWLFDPFAEALHRGSLPFSSALLAPLAADLIVWSEKTTPAFRSLLVSSLPIAEVGGSASHEIAWLLASHAEWLRLLAPFGITHQWLASQILLVAALRHDLFLEIAKLRAIRRVLSRFWQVCGVPPKEHPFEIFARSSLVRKTAIDPWTNLLRTTSEGIAAALGGTAGIALSSLDACLGPPDAFGRRMASNTQVLLQEEAQLGRVFDPAGGSFYLEALTSDLAHEGWRRFQAIEVQGGLLASLREGSFQESIKALRREEKRRIDTRKEPILGVTSFPSLDQPNVSREEKHPPVGSVGSAGSVGSVASVSPPSDDPSLVSEMRDWSLGAAPRGAALVSLTRAFERGGSIASALGVLRSLLPLDEPFPALPPQRIAEAFEDVRRSSDSRLQTSGQRPSALLLSFGSAAKLKPRIDFTRQLLEVGGIAVLDAAFEGIAPDDGTLQAALDAAAAHPQTSLFAICAEDATYPALLPRLAEVLKASSGGPHTLLVAGKPGEGEAIYRKAGVDAFAYLGCDALALLRSLLVSP